MSDDRVWETPEDGPCSPRIRTPKLDHLLKYKYEGDDGEEEEGDVPGVRVQVQPEEGRVSNEA